MPVLNREIIEDVLLQLLQNKNNLSEDLQKFLVSGRQPFDVALKYFGRVIYGIEFYHDDMRITTVDDERVTRIYRIRYDFGFCTPFLIAIGNTVKKLVIRSDFPAYMTDAVTGKLSGTNLKEVHYLSDIPPGFYQILDYFNSAEKFSFCGVDDLSIISTLPQSCKILELNGCNFAKLVGGKNHVQPFPQVQELYLRGDFEITQFDEEKIKQMSTFLSLKFPNLKYIKSEFSSPIKYWKSNPECKTYNFQLMSCAQIFSNLQGSIEFIIHEGCRNHPLYSNLTVSFDMHPSLLFKVTPLFL